MRLAPILATLALALPAAAQEVVRGPYLQQQTPGSVVVRWTSDAAYRGRVRFGRSLDALTGWADEGTSTTNHVVTVTGLTPNRTYYYSIGTPTAALRGGTADYAFVTPPPAGTPKPTRIWVIGDAGSKNSNQRAVRDAYAAFTGTRHTDLWLMLGDNAYPDGTLADYQAAVFDMYAAMLRKSAVWPTFGNHDALSADSTTQSGVYYDLFTLPKNGEAGGVPSGTEAYYAFDYGNIHFICLDTEHGSLRADGAMAAWLRNDLALVTADWIVAFFHHPPYSKGTHDTDSASKFRLIRENLLPILEDGGVDVVLTGHSHVYERSFLLDGHYGLSSTFTDAMKRDGGDGRENGDGVYRKSPGNPSHEGAVYVVAGSSGLTASGPLNHPAMVVGMARLGSVVLDVDGGRLDAKFIRETGAVDDFFTIVKGSTTGLVNVVTPTASTSEAGPPASFIVTRSGSTAAAATLAYTLGGTATSGVDYAPLPAQILIPAGQSSVTIPLTPVDDGLAEGGETVTLQLQPSGSYLIGSSGTATVTIEDAGGGTSTPPPPPPPPPGPDPVVSGSGGGGGGGSCGLLGWEVLALLAVLRRRRRR